MFPALARNDYVYLNSGGSGPPPYPVIEAMRAADDRASTRLFNTGDDIEALAKAVGRL